MSHTVFTDQIYRALDLNVKFFFSIENTANPTLYCVKRMADHVSKLHSKAVPY